MLVYFLYLDKNPGWVTYDNGYEEFPEDFQACGQPVDVPCDEAPRESYLLFSAVMYKTKLYYDSDV